MCEKLSIEVLQEFAESLTVCCLTPWRDDERGKQRLYVNDLRRNWLFQSGKCYIGKTDDIYYFVNLLDDAEIDQLTSDQKDDLELIQEFVEQISPKPTDEERQSDIEKFFGLGEDGDTSGSEVSEIGAYK